MQLTWIAYVDELGALGSGLTVNGGFAANFLTCAWASAIPPLDGVPDPELLPAELLLPPLDDVPDAELLPAEPLLPQPAVTVATATTAIATTATRFQLVLTCTVLSPLIRTIDLVRAADAHPNGRGPRVWLRLSQIDCNVDI